MSPSLLQQTPHMLPAATDVPDPDLATILLDVADDSVAAPSDVDTSALVSVVQQADANSIDLSVVVLESRLPRDSELRDLATTVGAEEGGTVLVLAPGQVGTFSASIDRVTLEAGQDQAYDADVVVSARNFVDVISHPGPPWAAITVLLILVVAAVAGATWWAGVRRFRRASSGTEPVGAGSARPTAES